MSTNLEESLDHTAEDVEEAAEMVAEAGLVAASETEAEAEIKTVTETAVGDAGEQTEPLDDLPQTTHEKIKTVQISEPYIEIAKRCNLGIMRQRNEDAMFSFVALTGGPSSAAPFALGLVADGMGGHHGGDMASRMVSRMVGEQVLNRIYLPMLRDSSPPPITEVMLEAVETANQALYTSDPEKEGGTTLTAVLIAGQRLFLVHVGDSRAYLLDETTEGQPTLHTLTTDHSVVQRLQDAGQITAEEAETHPHRNLLYRAITGHELETDMYTRSLPMQGKILVCSDGLWGAMEQNQLMEILTDPALPLQAQVDLLVETALLGGSTDNITAVVISFGY